jgi:putative hydrolase of the HAD superfamily
MAWLVCDYGEVISRPQSEDDLAGIAAMCGRDGAAFAEAYWSVRPDYDRGDIDAHAFWRSIAAGELGPERLAALSEADVASWTRLDESSMRAVERAEHRGYRLALLSNAPFEVARLLDAHPWFGRFEHRLFSCDLRLTKPDPAIYHALLTRLGCEPGEATFVDDRAANIAAAEAVGIRAIEYSSPEIFDDL